MLWRLLLIIIAGFSAILPAFGATLAELNPARHYKTAAILISGNLQFPDDQLRAIMETKTRPFYKVWLPRPKFYPGTFKRDLGRLNRFYQAHGYYAAKINYHLAVKGKLVHAYIHVIEGKPVRVKSVRVDLEGAAPEPKTLAPGFTLPLRPGAVFSESAYQLGESQLLQTYLEHGYAHARVRRQAEIFVGARRAYIWYVIKPGDYGVFGTTRVTGSFKVAPGLILRELTYRPGQTFDSRKIAASRAKIVGLNLFSSVEFIPQLKRAEPNVVPIEIRVHEKPKHVVNLAIGYNTETQFNAGIRWDDYNFLGGGRWLTLLAQYSNIISSGDVKLAQPYFLSPNSTFVTEGSLYEEIYQTYTLNAVRFAPRENYQFLRPLTGSFGWRLEYMKFNSLDPRTIAAIGGIRRNGILSGPYLQLVWNDTESPFNPKHGEIATLYANTASHLFGSDYRYWRAIGEIRKYQLLEWNTVLATRFKLGFENTLGSIRDIPLSDRFYSGGEGSVRGYGLRRIGPLSAANQPLGGLSLVEGSVELRHPLFWKFSGAAFFDCGQVSTHPYRFPVDSLQCGYGPAVSVATPVGPMRIDLGFPTKAPPGDAHWQVYFSIGQFF